MSYYKNYKIYNFNNFVGSSDGRLLCIFDIKAFGEASCIAFGSNILLSFSCCYFPCSVVPSLLLLLSSCSTLQHPPDYPSTVTYPTPLQTTPPPSSIENRTYSFRVLPQYELPLQDHGVRPDPAAMMLPGGVNLLASPT